MKKIMLLMLLLLSNLIFSQSTAIKNIPDSQIPEIYKGLKQNEFLKVKLQKTEVALTSANELINQQDKALIVGKNLLNAKDETIGTLKEVYKQDKIAGSEREGQLRLDISSLKTEIELMKIQSQKIQRKKLWSGIKIGGVSVAVLGVAGLILLNNK